jgi:general secretion pathway protein K
VNISRVSYLLKSNRGVALLITLTVTTVMIAITLTLHTKIRASVESSAIRRDLTILSNVATSGIHAAMAILVKDRQESEIDTVQEDWAQPEIISEMLAALPFDRGTLMVDISDERSRIQVNALVALPGHDFNPAQFRMWDRFLGFLVRAHEPLNELDHMAIINSLKDWIDSGDDDATTGLTGAESSYYLDLDPSYPCRNGPLDHIHELTRIKDVTPALFSSGEDMPGISDFLTIHGMVEAEGGKYTFDGKININTADIPVLIAILPEDYEDYAVEIYDYRIEKSSESYVNELTGINWYKDVPGLEDLELDSALITNTSDLFRITSAGKIGDTTTTITTIIRREKDTKTGKWWCKVLRWQEK